MNVPLTESRLPGGIDAIGQLGFSKVSIDKKYAVVSYLPSPLAVMPDLRELAPNRYVLFCLDSSVTDIDPLWEIKIFMPANGRDAVILEKQVVEKTILDLDNTITQEVHCLRNAHRLTVSLEVKGKSLVLEHQLIRSEPYVQNAAQQNITPKISAGSDFLTRLVNSSYQEQMKDLASIDELLVLRGNRSKRNVIASIIYHNYLNYYSRKDKWDYTTIGSTDPWYTFLNAPRDNEIPFELLPSKEDLAVSVGNCDLRPELVAMYLDSNMQIRDSGTVLDKVVRLNDDWPTYRTKTLKTFLDRINPETGDADQSLISSIIDIYNLIRFPRSAIRTCSLILDQIKNSQDFLSDMNWDEIVFSEKDDLELILENYFYGPDHTLAVSSKSKSSKAATGSKTDYIKMVNAPSFCGRLRETMYSGIPISTEDHSRFIQHIQSLKLMECQSDMFLSVYLMDDPNETMIHPDQEESAIYYGGYEMRCQMYIIYQNPENDPNFATKYYWLQTTNRDVLFIPGGLQPERYIEHANLTQAETAIRNNITSLGSGSAADFDDGVAGFTYLNAIQNVRNAKRFIHNPISLKICFKESYDQSAPEHVEFETEIPETALNQMETQILAFLDLARDYFCKTLNEELGNNIKKLMNDCDFFRIMKNLYSHLQQYQIPAEWITTNADHMVHEYVGHGLNLTKYDLREPRSVRFDVPVDYMAQIPRVIRSQKTQYLKNTSILFKNDRPTQSESESDEYNWDILQDDDNGPTDLVAIFLEIRDLILQTITPLALIINGYADKRFGSGSEQQRILYNSALSERRANWLRNRFIQFLTDQNANDDSQVNYSQGLTPESSANNTVAIMVRWCGDHHAPNVADERPEYRDARLLLIPLDEIDPFTGYCHT